MKGSHVYAQSDKKDKMSLKVMLNNKRDRTTFDLVELDKNMVRGFLSKMQSNIHLLPATGTKN